MNRVFYIFRHGETDWNAAGRLQGHVDTELNAAGLEQAKKLADFFALEELALEHIYTSDLIRARRTSEEVAFKSQINITCDQRLREVSFGEAEGMLYHEAEKLFGESLFHDNHPTKIAAKENFIKLLYEIIESSPFKNVGIGTHGGILRNVLSEFLPKNSPKVTTPNCVVYRLVYHVDRKKFELESTPLFSMSAKYPSLPKSF